MPLWAVNPFIVQQSGTQKCNDSRCRGRGYLLQRTSGQDLLLPRPACWTGHHTQCCPECRQTAKANTWGGPSPGLEKLRRRRGRSPGKWSSRSGLRLLGPCCLLCHLIICVSGYPPLTTYPIAPLGNCPARRLKVPLQFLTCCHSAWAQPL